MKIEPVMDLQNKPTFVPLFSRLAGFLYDFEEV